MTRVQRLLCPCIMALLLAFMWVDAASAAPLIPNVNIDVGSSENPQDVAVTLQLMAVLTILSIAPSILIMTTAFMSRFLRIRFQRQRYSQVFCSIMAC